MGAGKRRQIRKQICDILTEFVVTAYFEKHVEGSTLYSTAGEIMRLFPKPEKCIMYRILSPNGVEYYKCSKCDGVQFDVPHRFCPHCGRRRIATEDKSIWQ